jgi:hypothetical protein|tara:strand:- start:714 stop:857 length:144 start_codon:yes stop_codon:yes gene_type:complete
MNGLYFALLMINSEITQFFIDMLLDDLQLLQDVSEHLEVVSIITKSG